MPKSKEMPLMSYESKLMYFIRYPFKHLHNMEPKLKLSSILQSEHQLG